MHQKSKILSLPFMRLLSHFLSSVKQCECLKNQTYIKNELWA